MTKQTDKQTPASTSICTATCDNGQPCRGRALGSGLCLAHDPRFEAARAEWRKRGGHHRSTAARAEKRLANRGSQWLLDLMTTVIAETYSGQMQPNRATAIASIVGSYVKLYDLLAIQDELDLLAKQLGVNDA